MADYEIRDIGGRGDVLVKRFIDTDDQAATSKARTIVKESGRRPRCCVLREIRYIEVDLSVQDTPAG